MLEILASISPTVLKAIGMIVSAIIGLVMSVRSNRSVNYRKIDKRALGAILLYALYLNIVVFVISTVGGVLIVLFLAETIASLALLSAGMAVLSILIFWGLILRTKRMKMVMDKARNVSRRLFLMINLNALISLLLGFAAVPFVLLEQQNWVMGMMIYANWALIVWWLYLIIIFLWKTAKYVYSEMKITLLDGEVIQHSCRPQMCRVHKHYVRLLKRNEEGVIMYERHINEAAIKQIEYS